MRVNSKRFSKLPSILFASMWLMPHLAHASNPSSGLETLFASALEKGEFSWAGLLALVAGLLTALSPCVYPLIPITLSIMGTRRYESRLQGFTVSAAYVLGMVILYSALGVGFASLGMVAGSSLQSPWVSVGVSLLFFVTSLSMFGAFELVLPQPLLNRLSQVGGSGHRGAFLMGLVAGVIAAPCTGPVLTFILTLIAGKGDLLGGTALMTLYGVGMGLPFLALGTFSSALTRLPKSGSWMDVVKNVFGVSMLGVSIYYLQVVLAPLHVLLDRFASLGAWSLLGLMAVGLMLGALKLSFKKGHWRQRILPTLGVLLIAFAANGIGNWSVQAPLNTELSWQVVGSEADALARFNMMLKIARDENKPVIVDFYADWCIACKELDRYTYVDAGVIMGLARFARIKVDSTQDTDALRELQSQYGVVGLPTVLFIDATGQVLPSPRLFGFVKAEAFLQALEKVR